MFYSMSEVCSMFNVSRTTIGRWEHPKHGCGFPRRVHLGIVRPVVGKRVHKRSNCRIGYPKSEVDAWAKARMDERQLPLNGDADTPDEE